MDCEDKKMNNLANLCMVYSKLGDNPKAINYLLEALRLAQRAELKMWRPRCIAVWVLTIRKKLRFIAELLSF